MDRRERASAVERLAELELTKGSTGGSADAPFTSRIAAEANVNRNLKMVAAFATEKARRESAAEVQRMSAELDARAALAAENARSESSGVVRKSELELDAQLQAALHREFLDAARAQDMADLNAIRKRLEDRETAFEERQREAKRMLQDQAADQLLRVKENVRKQSELQAQLDELKKSKLLAVTVANTPPLARSAAAGHHALHLPGPCPAHPAAPASGPPAGSPLPAVQFVAPPAAAGLFEHPGSAPMTPGRATTAHHSPSRTRSTRRDRDDDLNEPVVYSSTEHRKEYSALLRKCTAACRVDSECTKQWNSGLKGKKELFNTYMKAIRTNPDFNDITCIVIYLQR